MSSSLSFILNNKRFLFFGLLLTFFSTFGQTSFLATFTPIIQNNFMLTPSKIGLIYSLSTMSSALAISLFGGKIDHSDLKTFTIKVALLCSIGCLSLAFCHSSWILFFGYFLLRFSCQGLMSHTSMVSMARYFHDQRGLALGIAALGYPLGDALLPVIALFLLKKTSLNQLFFYLFIFSILFILPTLIFLLKGHRLRHENYLKNLKEDQEELSISPKEVLKDWKFYCVTIGILAPGFIITGIFFQNASLLMSKNWPEQISASSLLNSAIGSLIGSFIFGSLIDRFRSINVLPFYLFPMLMGLVVLDLFQPVYTIYIFMLSVGISMGGSSVIIGAVWAEMYGPKYLGTIRSWVSSLKILFTALSPFLFGFLLDRAISFSHLLIGSSLYTITSIGLLSLVSLRFSRQKKAEKV